MRINVVDIESTCSQVISNSPSSTPQGTNLASLLLTLQKTLASSLSSCAIPRDQFVVLRSASPPFQPTKAWSLHLDVTFTNIQGGNLADVMFAAVWAALNSVRLPRTRAIGFDTDLLNNRQTEGNLDSFDIKGSLAKTRGVAIGKGNKKAAASSGQILATTDPSIKEKTGVDFEVMDVYDSGIPIEGSKDFPLAVTVNLVRGRDDLSTTFNLLTYNRSYLKVVLCLMQHCLKKPAFLLLDDCFSFAHHQVGA